MVLNPMSSSRQASQKGVPKRSKPVEELKHEYVVNGESLSQKPFKLLEADPDVKLRKIGLKRTYVEGALTKLTHYYRMK